MTKKNPAAVSLGRRGGRAKTDAKAAAARANGQKGGRPRKLCGEAHGLWFCTRPAGHDGLHVATVGPYEADLRPLASWPSEAPTRRPGRRFVTAERVALARQFKAQYATLERANCTLVEWLMLRFSCTDDQATRLLEAL